MFTEVFGATRTESDIEMTLNQQRIASIEINSFTEADDGITAHPDYLFMYEDKMQAFSEIRGLRGLTQRPPSESRKNIIQNGKKKPFPMWTMIF